MNTFTDLKALVENPGFPEQRQRALNQLDPATIDAPIVDVITYFAILPYCYTLQSCYGHFIYSGQEDAHNLDPLPSTDITNAIHYRIAYIALVIENNDSGRSLFEELKKIPEIDPNYIQFGCANWFWNQQVNSYALQVEPKEHMYKDSTYVKYDEALHLEKTKELFFAELRELLRNHLQVQ